MGAQCSFPPSENVAYLYVEHLRISRAPPTRAQGVLEALAFCKGTLALARVDEVLTSPRATGAALRCYEEKRLTRKALPVRVSTLRALEDYVSDGADLYDRHLAGFLLFLVYSRSRCRDASRVRQEPQLDASIDGTGFIQTCAEKMKGTRGQKKLRLGVPIAAFRKGLSDKPWADAWLAARALLSRDARKDGALFQAVGPGGHYVPNVPMTSSQLNYYGRALIKKLANDSEAFAFSSHACKATALSWAAKAGMRVPDRRLLGGHAKPGEKSALEYSRDALAGPLFTLERLAGCIKAGQFNPYGTRSGRRVDGCGPWLFSDSQAPAVRPQTAQEPSPSEVPVPSSSSSSGPSTSASSSASGDNAEGMLALDDDGNDPDDVAGKYRPAHHVFTLTKHAAEHGAPTFFCGRAVTARFRWGAAAFMPLCEGCERRNVRDEGKRTE